MVAREEANGWLANDESRNQAICVITTILLLLNSYTHISNPSLLGTSWRDLSCHRHISGTQSSTTFIHPYRKGMMRCGAPGGADWLHFSASKHRPKTISEPLMARLSLQRRGQGLISVGLQMKM